jgi:hypothetical protein
VAKKKRARKRRFDFTFFAAEPRPAALLASVVTGASETSVIT